MDKKFKAFSNIEDIKEFIFGGNATITIESKKTGKHYTFKVKAAKKDEKSPFFVSLLNGADNYANYTYIGMITDDKKLFKLTQKSKVSDDTISYKAFNYFFKNILKDNLGELNVYHSGKCGRCGRKLTTPESIERGLGPSCYKKSKSKK